MSKMYMYVMSLQVERARVRFLDQLVRERQLEHQLEGVDDVGPVGEEVVYCSLTLSQTTNFRFFRIQRVCRGHF